MAQFSSKHGIVPIFDSSDSLESKKNGSSMKIQHTSLMDGATRFPKLEECAHFHYDFVELGQLQLQLCEEDQENYHHQEYEQSEYQFMLRVMSKDKTWNIRRSYENFRMLDKQLHKCIFDRRFSHLPELASQDDLMNINEAELQELLQKYLERFSSIAGSMIYCGSILNWLEMDNRGDRLLAVDDSGINTPAIAAAHAIRHYNAQAADEISLEIGDIVSVIDKPPPEDTMWWRGKRGFEVGFFPGECVELIGDKVPQSMASRIPPPSRKPSSGPVKRGSTWNEGASGSAATPNPSSDTVLRKHSKLISFLQRFFFTRPARNQLKRSGIVKERVFGCDLGEHLLNSGHDVPLVLKCCAEVIEKHGIVDGIYRLSGINSNIQKLRHAFDEDRVPNLADETYLQDIHSISSLLKMYFRELPNPLLTYQLYDKFAKAVQDEDKLHLIHDVVQQLPPPHYRTTEYLIRHLARVAGHGRDTGMHSKNLAIVWAPNLLRSKELELGGGVAALQGVSIQAVVTEFLICYADLIFSDKMPSYSSPELRQSQKKPRPKSLAISTPTRLLTLEEARERALSSHNVPAQKYIDVGGGPEKLPPKYHTVLDLPGYKKKTREPGSMTTLVKPKKSPVSGWKSFFSKSRSSSVKQKARKSSLQGLIYDPDGAGSVSTMERKAITEEDVHNWKKRRLRSAKSAESLLSLSSHKNSISSASSSARNSRGLTESDLVVNLYSGDDCSRVRHHKRSLSSDASTVLLHHEVLPLHDRTNSDITHSAVAVDFNLLNHDDDDEPSVSSDDSSDENEVPPQLNDVHGQTRQSFIRGDSTRRAIAHRKTSSAPSTPQQQNRQESSNNQMRLSHCESDEDDDNTKKNSSSDELNIFKGKLVKSVEFVEPLDLSMSFLMSKSEDSLVSRRGSSALEKEITYELSQLGKSEPHMSGLKHRQAYYSRVHDYAEIDESQISAPDSVLEKAKLRPCAMKEEQEEAARNSNIVSKPEFDKQSTSPVHSPTIIVFTPSQKIGVCKNKETDPGLTSASNDSSPEHTTQLRSDLLSEIAKLEDSISPINYLQKEEMSKCLSVPSDIGKSLENVNLGSQSDLMSGVSISELSQSIDSISVNDSMDLDLSTITGNYSDSKTLTICKEINKAFSSCNTKAFETQEKGVRRSTSDLPSSYREPKQGECDLKNYKLKQGRSSLNEKSSNYAITKIEAMKKSLVDQECQPSHLSSSVSDNCVRRENKAKMEPAKRYSHHIIDKPKPESANPLFIVESPPSFTSLDNFTQMLQFYAPAEVQHMMSESSDYWNRQTSGQSTNSAIRDEGNGEQSKSHISHQLSPSSVCKYHNELSPLDIDFTQFGSKEPTPVSSPSTVCKSPNLWPLSDIDILDDSDRNVGKRKSDTFEHKCSSSSSLDGIPQKSPSLADTGEDNMMIRSLPAGTSIIDPIAELNSLTSSDSNSSKNRTCSEGSLLPCKIQSISQSQKQYPFSTQETNSSQPQSSLRRWESMDVQPSLDSTMVFSPAAVISTSHSDSEFLTLGLTPDQNHSMPQSERDSCETLISSPSSPFSSKNYQILYGTLQSCAARPTQSCIPDLDNIMNMSREEISNAEKLILSEEEKARLQQIVGDCSKKVPLASPEISTVSDQSDVCSDKKQTDSMSESRSREKLIQNQTSLKKSRTDSALGQSRQKAPPRSELSDSQLTNKKSADFPSSPTKCSSQKDGIDKLQCSFITDHLESAIDRIPESVAKEPQLMPEKQGVTSANEEKKLPDSKKYYSSPVISEVLTCNQNRSYNWTGTKSKSFPVSQLSSDQYQISPPEDDVLIQIRPTLKRPVSPRRRLIEKMKQDAKRREAAQKDIELSSGEKASSLSVPSSTADKNSKHANNLAMVRQPSELQTQAEGTNDSLKARSLDSLLTQLKPKSGDQEKSLKEKDTFDWVMSSGSSDIPKVNSKASSGAATSSDMDVVQDMEMTDSVFTDDAAVDLRGSKKQSKAGQKCASNICQSVKDTTNNRSSLDESILQVAAERHNAFEGFGTNPNGTQQYDTGSLRHPKARKLQNLKEFFEHEELKNRPGYARPLTSSTSTQNSPNCPKYQRYSSKEKEEEKKENTKQSASSPSRILRNTHHRSRSRERKDTKQGGYSKDSPSTHSRSPTPSGRKPAALEKWQRAESHERDGKQTWEMGVDYVQGKSLKSDQSMASAAATKPPPHSGSSRARTWSESSASDADIKSPPSQRAKDERRKCSTSTEYFKSVRSADQSTKSDTSDSEGKLSFLEMEIIGEEQLSGHKRRGSIKDLRNYFEAKQVSGEEKKLSCSASSADTINASTFTTHNSNLMTLSCTSLSTESTQTSSPRQVPRSRVKSLSPVCGQSELKSDSDLAHKGSSRFSLDFSSYTSRPHVEGIVRPQPVRLGPKPFYGAKT